MNRLLSNVLFPAMIIGTAATLVIIQAEQTQSQIDMGKIAKPVTVLIQSPLKIPTRQKDPKTGQMTIVKDPKTGATLMKQLESGSGVIVAKQNQTYSVVTAAHVLSGGIGTIIENGDERITAPFIITTSDQEQHRVNLKEIKFLTGKAGQEELDLAVLQFTSNKDYEFAEIANSDDLDVNNRIYVSGFPLPDGEGSAVISDFTLTNGNISSIKNNDENGYNLVYTAPTRVGMSGGPVFNQSGAVIGIHGSAYKAKSSDGSSGGKEQGFNKAIPINIFQKEQKNAKLNIPLKIAKTLKRELEQPEPMGGLKPIPVEEWGGQTTRGVCLGDNCQD
jgi:serine protease Do